jgi:hypothetical protein
VNVAARQFRDVGFVASVRGLLDESGLVPSALMLELTESGLLHRDERINSDLAELKDAGVRLAIDDFGTGYSSLSYLRELPIDVLKIDKSFVEGIASSGQRLALAKGIVEIARTLEIDVIAEGIETEEQRTLMTDMGCTGRATSWPGPWPGSRPRCYCAPARAWYPSFRPAGQCFPGATDQPPRGPGHKGGLRPPYQPPGLSRAQATRPGEVAGLRPAHSVTRAVWWRARSAVSSIWAARQAPTPSPLRSRRSSNGSRPSSVSTAWWARSRLRWPATRAA